MHPELGQVIYFEGHDYVFTDVDPAKGLAEFRRPRGLVKGDTPYRRGVCALSELRAVDRAVGVALAQDEAARLVKAAAPGTEGGVFAAGQVALARFMAMASGEQVWVLPLRVLPIPGKE